jgi:hypothetical protein
VPQTQQLTVSTVSLQREIIPNLLHGVVHAVLGIPGDHLAEFRPGDLGPNQERRLEPVRGRRVLRWPPMCGSDGPCNGGW